ncbi:MAG: hypothetical protein ABI606_20355 [Rhodoferax sp.]
MKESDKAHFIALVLAEFNAPHAGNPVRFGIGPMEFAAWRERPARFAGLDRYLLLV